VQTAPLTHHFSARLALRTVLGIDGRRSTGVYAGYLFSLLMLGGMFLTRSKAQRSEP